MCKQSQIHVPVKPYYSSHTQDQQKWLVISEWLDFRVHGHASYQWRSWVTESVSARAFGCNREVAEIQRLNST